MNEYEANASATSLSELIPLVGSALELMPGQTLSLGNAFEIGGSQDLRLEFYLVSEPLDGDFNADGTVDAEDLGACQAGYGTVYSGRDFLK